MFKFIDERDLKEPVIYVAVLEKDCTPHYYGCFGNATDYIWNNLPKEMQEPEYWQKLNTYNEKEDCWLIDKFGWIEKVTLEDN